jgi:tetrahydromethanopterin S-methyltransferase subunit H
MAYPLLSLCHNVVSTWEWCRSHSCSECYCYTTRNRRSMSDCWKTESDQSCSATIAVPTLCYVEPRWPQ